MVNEIAITEADSDQLVGQFAALIKAHWETNAVRLFFDTGERFESPDWVLPKNRPAYRALCELAWATPESLERRQKKPTADDLREFIAEQNIGLIVASPGGSFPPSLLIALGTKSTLWPYSYPEVQRLQNIAELMDNILTRSRLTTQAALTARVEHLAMMSRGLAHDLKNLITPVSSFLIHTDGRYSSETPEAEVHSAARRSVKIMSDYVREALFFSEQLAPNFEPVDVAALFRAVSEISASRAHSRRVAVSFAATPSLSLTADAVLLQRMLGNLVGNAIDASRAGQRVNVSASPIDGGKICFQVQDDGCGIAPETLARIFDPYFTTKQFGDEVRGFGLGLTICQKIVDLHRGNISVKSQVQAGTTICVNLPLDPRPPKKVGLGS